MAIVQKQFSDLITFTRSSAGGRFNERGLFEMVPANQPRFDYDPVTKLPLGLLIEGSRTNVVTNSTDLTKWGARRVSLSKADLPSPDGAKNAALAIANANEDWHQVLSPTFPVVQGLTYTASVYVKPAGKLTARLTIENATLFPVSHYGRFNILDGTVLAGIGATISPVGAGWFRISVVSTALLTGTTIIALGVGDTGVAGNDQDGVMYWGAQVEAGSFATSYIPTTNSQVTHAADVVSVNVLAPWYNRAEGALIVKGSGDGLNGTLAEFSDGTSLNRWILALNRDAGAFAVVNNNVPTFLQGVAGPMVKIGGTLGVGNAAVSVNGAAPIAGANTATPACTVLRIGQRSNGTSPLNGHVQSIKYYPRRLTGAELQALISEFARPVND